MIEKYKKMPLGVKASFWYTVCSILQRCISVFTVPLFTRLLSTEQYGLLALYQSWTGIFIIFTTLNLQYGSFNTAMVKYEEDRDTYISAISGLCLSLTCLWACIYFVLSRSINVLTGLPTFLMFVLLLETLATSILGFWTGKKRFDYQYKGFILVTLLMSVLSPILGIVMVTNVSMENRGSARILSNALVVIVIGIIFFIYNVLKGKKVFVKKHWKYALSFNIPLIPYYLSQVVFNQSDRIMISRMVGNDKAGIYSVAYQISIILSFVLNAINNSYVPWVYKKMKEKDYGGIDKATNIIAGLMAALLLGIVIIAPEIILIMGGQAYYEAIWIVPPVAATVLLTFYTQLFINIEFYFEEKNYLVAGSILSALVNIVLNFLLIPKVGYIVAGYTTLISYLIFCLMNYFCMKKACQKNNIDLHKARLYDYKFLIALFVFFAVTSGISMVLYNFLFIRYVIITSAIISLIGFRKKKIINKFKTLNLK